MVKEFNPRRLFFGQGEIALCGDPAVALGEKSWTPDESTAYIKFCLSFAFPNISNYGDGIHPGVIGRSFQTMQGKPVNSNHKMVVYGANSDAIVGTIVGVDYPVTPDGGWKTSKDKQAAPFMTGVAALWLTASPTEQWISRYADQRKHVAVSMEVFYGVAASGFAVARQAENGSHGTNGTNEETRIPGSSTPDEFWEAGWEYVPMSALLTDEQMKMDAPDIAKVAAKAPKDSLLRTRDFRAKRMIGGSLLGSGLVGSWTPPGSNQARDVYFLQGGVAGQVHYPGMGLVEQGAEVKAGIETMLAADEDAASVVRSMEEMTELVRSTAAEL